MAQESARKGTAEPVLPGSIIVGAHEYEVVTDDGRWAAALRKEGDPNLLALFVQREGAIYVDAGQVTTQQADSLVHEVLHAIWAHGNVGAVLSGLREDCDREEVLIGLLAPVLLQVLRDNPDLVQYLAEV